MVTDSAKRRYQADVALAGQREELTGAAREAERQLREAQAAREPVTVIRPLAVALDEALSAAVRAAYAAQRAAIGPDGYVDRIAFRKGLAKPAVHALTAEAEHLLTLRETHRLNGIPDVPLAAI